MGIPVDWVLAPGPAPVWLDVAREYTERWIHQAQLRDATGRPRVDDRWALYPVFDTFMLALPNALWEVAAPEGANVHVTVRGAAGCTWIVRKTAAGWEFGSDRVLSPSRPSGSTRTMPGGSTPKVSPNPPVLPRIEQHGDPAALAAMLGMVTVLA